MKRTSYKALGTKIKFIFFQYEEQFARLWNKYDLWGFMAREILEAPCTIHTYVKSSGNQQNIVRQNLPARLSLRRFGSHAFIVWITIGYIIFKIFSFSGFTYVFLLLITWSILIFIKASLKMLKVLNQ